MEMMTAADARPANAAGWDLSEREGGRGERERERERGYEYLLLCAFLFSLTTSATAH
jgi:hypothetical protein